MSAPTVPFYGKDSERLAKLSIASKVLSESGSFLEQWPATVPTPELFHKRINDYNLAYQDAIHHDRRAIAARISAAELAGVTWQKIVNYACATEQDNSVLLERMGVPNKVRRSSSTVPRELYAPDLTVINLDQKGATRSACTRDRRRYTYDLWVTEGDPRVEEGWRHQASFGDCTKMDVYGFQSGKEYSFRCRIIGPDNTAGPWSKTVTIMVT